MRIAHAMVTVLLVLSLPGIAGAVGPHPGEVGVPFCNGVPCGWKIATIPSSLPYEVVLKDAIYVNSTILVVVGWQGTILRSIDSGRDWVKVPSPIANDAYNVVAFAPGGLLLAGGDNGSLVASPSEGAGWTLYPSNGLQGSVYSMGFPSATFGYAATSTGLFVTTDGAQKWNSVKTPTPGSVNAAVFTSPSTGWINVGAVPLVYRTTNGGATWEPVAMGLPNEFISNFVAEGPTDLWALDNHGDVWRSYDGVNFTKSNLTTGQKTWQLAAVGSSAWVVSDNANNFYTTNDGQCWIEESVPQIPELYTVTFTTATDGIAAGDGVIWYTTNAGLGGNDSSSCAGPSSAPNYLLPLVVIGALAAVLVAGTVFVRSRSARAPIDSAPPPSDKAINETRRKLKYRERKRYVRR